MTFHQNQWGGGRGDELLPQVTWAEVEAGLLDLATTDLKRRMTRTLVTGVRNQAGSKPSRAVIAELFCLAWLLGDEAFDPAEGLTTVDGPG